MFASLRRTFGAIKVTEGPTDIQVIGVPADIMARDISKMWSSKRINQWMFTSLGKNSFSFPKFFAVEVHYMLQQVNDYRNAKSTSRTLLAIIQELEANTWLQRIIQPEIKSRTDPSKLANLNLELFKHQHGFIEAYGELTERYGLNGYMAAADPGTGKTIMTLATAETLDATAVIIVVPKVSIDRVWVKTISEIYKHKQALWVANGTQPYKGERIILGHYEALPKIIEAARHANHGKAVVVLDESHNLNEIKSLRTQLFIQLCQMVNSHDVIWASGTPLKAMGYEVIPFLRSIDPLFTPDVEQRFLKIFGKESGRALDILRNRIGKVSFHVEKGDIRESKTTSVSVNVKLPNGHEYTLDSIRDKMGHYIDERMAYYAANMKKYKADYENGLALYEKVMLPTDKDNYKHYQRAVREISRGYDQVAHKEEAAFVNQFEAKVIIPAIPNRAAKEAFKHAKSVIKYVNLKVMGEALGGIVGKARSQCHVDMVPHIDWTAIANNAEKKVVVFTSYVEVVKAIESELKKRGYESLLVYGDTTSNVAGIVNQFEKDPKVKFLIATYQSLSTAVPLTMADTSVFVNAPFRSHEKEQAEARTDRIGQDSGVKFINTYLDTGKAPNISTRSKDILQWSKEQVEAIMGQSPGISSELNKDFNAGALESYRELGTMFVPAFESMLLELQAA